MTRAGGVVGDRLDAAGVQCPFERIPHLDVASETHYQQQRLPVPADRDSEQVAVDPNECGEALHRKWT
jgi:hypothetical protein